MDKALEIIKKIGKINSPIKMRPFSLLFYNVLIVSMLLIVCSGCGIVPSHWFTTSEEKTSFNAVYINMEAIHNKVKESKAEQIDKKTVEEITGTCLESLKTAKKLITGSEDDGK